MTALNDLPTPCLLIEQSRLTANISAMQARADAQGVRLRPHIKTHKSTRLGRMQRDAGARGVTVATTGEAECFVRAGFDDIRIAYPVIGQGRLERIASLRTHADVSFCIDTVAGAQAASAFFAPSRAPADVLIEVDVGQHRCGVDPEDARAVALARTIAESPGIRLAGILTHAGQVYKGPPDGVSKAEALRSVARHERDAMLRFAGRLQEAGLADPDSFEISIGSTPTMHAFENRQAGGFRITEIRPGNYIFHDAMQAALGAATLKDCALTALTTVVSRRRTASGKEQLFADAGSKTVATDQGALTDGYGQLLYDARRMEPLPHARIAALSEEHAWIDVPGGSTLEVGDRIRFVPNHACVCMHLHETAWLVDGDDVLDAVPIDARAR